MEPRTSRLLSRGFHTTADELQGGGLEQFARVQREEGKARKRQREEEKEARLLSRAGLAADSAAAEGYIAVSEENLRFLRVVGHSVRLHASGTVAGTDAEAGLLPWGGSRCGKPWPSDDAAGGQVQLGERDLLMVDRYDGRLLLHSWETFAKPPRPLRAQWARDLRAAHPHAPPPPGPHTSTGGAKGTAAAGRAPDQRGRVTAAQALAALGPAWSVATEQDCWYEAYRDAFEAPPPPPPPPPAADGAETQAVAKAGAGEDANAGEGTGAGTGAAAAHLDGEQVDEQRPVTRGGMWYHPFSSLPLPLPPPAGGGLPSTAAEATLLLATARRIGGLPPAQAAQLELLLRTKHGGAGAGGAGGGQLGFLQPSHELHWYYAHCKSRAQAQAADPGRGADWPAEPVPYVHNPPAGGTPAPAPASGGMSLVAYGDDDDDSSSSSSESEGGGEGSKRPAASSAAAGAPAGKRRSRFTALDPQVEAPLVGHSHYAGGGSSASTGAVNSMPATAPAPAPAAAPVPAAVGEVMDKLLAHALKAASAASAARSSTRPATGTGSTPEAFVQLLLQKERSNPRFAFLQPWSPYHAPWLSKLHAALLPPPAPPVAGSPPAAVLASQGEGQNEAGSSTTSSGEEAQTHHGPSPSPSPGPGPGSSPPPASASAEGVGVGAGQGPLATHGAQGALAGRKQALPPWQKAAMLRGYYLDEDSDGDLDECPEADENGPGHEPEPQDEGEDAGQGDSPHAAGGGDSDMDVT